jgi:hypothetical protein
VGAYKRTINKPGRRRSGSHTSHTKQRKFDEITRVARGVTSARLTRQQPPSHASSPNNAPPPRVAQIDHLMPVSGGHSHHRKAGNYTYPEHTTPLDILGRFLSHRVTKYPSPHTYDTDALSALFISVQTAGHLKKLEQVHLSSLISLFGTLSIFPARTHMYTNPLASQIRNKPHRTYWSFIAQIAMEKESICGRLTPSDHYWLMRADLAIINTPGQGASLDCKLTFCSFFFFVTLICVSSRNSENA